MCRKRRSPFSPLLFFSLSNTASIFFFPMFPRTLLSILFLCCAIVTSLAQPNPWQGRKVAFLGDSMTDPNNNATEYYYYDYLREALGIEPHIYAKSGNQWHQLPAYVERMEQELGQEVQGIFIFAGTNDFFHSCPMGEFFTEHDTVVNVNGKMVPRRHRIPCMTDTTFCGRVNRILSRLKHDHPLTPLFVMTPIHRAYANFSNPNRANVQPDENFANAHGLYIEDYVNALRQACQLWSVPCIDLFQLSGLYPLDAASYAQFFHDADTDLLHPNAQGHRRLGQVIEAQLRALPGY